MPTAALALVACAAVSHATYNALAKSGGDPFVFLWASLGLSAAWLTPAAVWLWPDAAALAAGWPYVAASTAIHILYFITLGQGYRHGEFSRVYPIARGLSVGLVGLGAWVVLHEAFSALGVAGIALVITGIAALGTYGQGRLHLGAGVGWALATGVLISGYSLVDKVGVSHLHPVVYFWMIGAGMTVGLVPLIARRPHAVRDELRYSGRRLVAASLVSLTSYLLVLFAFRLSHAGYVVASRELSIVISVVIGWRFLGERPLWPRLWRAGLIAAGVVCVALA